MDYNVLTLAAWVGSWSYYLVLAGGLIALIVIYKTMRGKSD